MRADGKREECVNGEGEDCARGPVEEGTYVWEPGPRDAGSWYVCVFKVENSAAKRSFGTDLRGGAGAIEMEECGFWVI